MTDLQKIAEQLDQDLTKLYGRRMGFALLCFDFNTEDQCDYVSNGEREDMVKALIEASVKLGISDKL